MKKNELRRHLGTVTLGLDTQWGLMHRQDLDDSTSGGCRWAVSGDALHHHCSGR